MTSSPLRPDVVVVGAGPVGLSLALGLARGDRSVLVLEKEASTAEHSRAPAIWPRTQEVLAGLGVAEAFLSRGISLGRIRLWDADRDRLLLELPVEELEGETAYPQLLIVPQAETERLLCEAVDACPTAEVLFSTEVVRVEQDDAGVRVTYRRVPSPRLEPDLDPHPHGPAGEIRTVAAEFAVGCDGARSTVREAIGASFEGGTYRVRAALADLRLREDRDLPFPRFSTRNGPAIGVRIDDDLWRLILPFGGDPSGHDDGEDRDRDQRREEERDPVENGDKARDRGGEAGENRDLDRDRGEEEDGVEAVRRRVERAARSLFPHVRSSGDYELVWQSSFRLHRRVSSRFVQRRIALAGDAAHLNSPVGGQGMNAGIQDTERLARALLGALEEGRAAPLREYDRRREAVESGVNTFTDRLTRVLLFRNGSLLKPLFRAAGVVLRLRPLRRAFLRRIAMLE